MLNGKEILRELLELRSQLAHLPNRVPYRVPSGYFESLSSLILLRIRSEGVDTPSEELKIIAPAVATLNNKHRFGVPEGYFESLPDLILLRIRAEGADTGSEELKTISTVLTGLNKKSPYSVPDGYFESLPTLVMLRTRAEGDSASEELKTLSPLLAELSKKSPYSVPQGYFESLPVVPSKKPQGKVVSMPRKVFKYAAAAVTAGLIILSAWFYLGNINESKPELATAVPDTSSELKKLETISEGEMAAFVEAGAAIYLPEPGPALGELAENDVQWLLSDVSDQELEQYLKQNNPTVEKFN